MIIQKQNAIGIDKAINTCISRINKALNLDNTWGIDIYHKIYREQVNTGEFAPFAFLNDKEYREVFINDSVVGEVGFYLNGIREIAEFVSVDCDVIFSINLDRIDKGSYQREDERAIMMAYDVVNAYSEITLIKTELSNVFSEFNTERIVNRNMQPFLNFSFTIKLNYKNSNCYGM